VATKDLIESKDLVLERPVPNIAHELPEIGHSAAKSRLLRLATNLVVAFAIARAVVGKAQKRERLWALALHAGLPLRKSTKLNQLGLARLQRKREFIESLAQNRLNSFSVFPKLEADYKVIDIPHQISLASQSRFDLPFEPEVQNLMQIQITQQHTDHSTYAKGNFQFERVVAGWRTRAVLDLRLKK
jgi:hypothetical protein